MNQRNPIVALLLSFIPGVGHAYLGRPIRFLLYGGGFFGSMGLLLLLLMSGGPTEGAVILLIIGLLFGVANFIDMVVSLVTGPTKGYEQAAFAGDTMALRAMEQQREKMQTILLSFVPGVGHMSIGLLQRGMTFLVSFIGLFAIVMFICFVTGTGEFLVFLLALPVIWIYSMFDAIQQLQRKHSGLAAHDRPFFEELEDQIGSGRKNKLLAMALSLFPGAGHLYLGMQKRGLQIMGGFLVAIYLMDSLRLSLFLFLMPLVWFFAFFDALQCISRYERSDMRDQPLFDQLAPYQRWIGVAMLGLGVYYLADQFMIHFIAENFPGIFRAYSQFKYNLPTIIVAFIMIAFGFRLLFGRGDSWPRSVSSPPPPPSFDPAVRETETGDDRRP
ncbi:hypothetical protein [Paenibacillus sp. NPDC058071]|uniref:hypothetical protein n=1 Tax=Paenibacillus sp. NPDC058071 TaxID=3346326 RepID=UPI0036D866CF